MCTMVWSCLQLFWYSVTAWIGYYGVIYASVNCPKNRTKALYQLYGKQNTSQGSGWWFSLKLNTRSLVHGTPGGQRVSRSGGRGNTQHRKMLLRLRKILGCRLQKMHFLIDFYFFVGIFYIFVCTISLPANCLCKQNWF